MNMPSGQDGIGSQPSAGGRGRGAVHEVTHALVFRHPITGMSWLCVARGLHGSDDVCGEACSHSKPIRERMGYCVCVLG